MKKVTMEHVIPICKIESLSENNPVIENEIFKIDYCNECYHIYVKPELYDIYLGSCFSPIDVNSIMWAFLRSISVKSNFYVKL